MDGTFVNSLILPAKGRAYSGMRSRGLVWLKNEAGQHFPNHFLKRNTKTVILYSHGNGGTLGDFKAIVNFYSEWFSTSVFAIEYPGYGPAEGEPSEESVNDNLTTAYTFLTEKLGYPAGNVIMIGYSIGTGPTLHLAADLCEKGTPPGSVVTIAAFKSLRDIVSDWKGTMFASLIADFLTNRWNSIEEVKKLTCPVFFIHGKLDVIIPSSHTVALHDACASEIKRMKVCPNADHSKFNEPYDTTDSISEFLEEYFSPDDTATVTPVPTEYMEAPRSVIAKEKLMALKDGSGEGITLIGENGCVHELSCVGNTFYNIFFFWLPSEPSSKKQEQLPKGKEGDDNAPLRVEDGAVDEEKQSAINEDGQEGGAKKNKKKRLERQIDLPDDNVLSTPPVTPQKEGKAAQPIAGTRIDPVLKNAFEVLDEYFACMSLHDIDKIVDCLDEEVLVRYPDEPDKPSKSWAGHSKARSRYGKMFRRSPQFKGAYKATATETEGVYATILAAARFSCEASGLNVIRDILYVVSTETNKIVIIDHK
jgi:pimeloyl-ACP methyl ester carboxylesterase